MSRLISFAVLIAIIIVIGLLFYNVMVGFFVPVFLAAVLVVVFHPLSPLGAHQDGPTRTSVGCDYDDADHGQCAPAAWNSDHRRQRSRCEG